MSEYHRVKAHEERRIAEHEQLPVTIVVGTRLRSDGRWQHAPQRVAGGFVGEDKLAFHTSS